MTQRLTWLIEPRDALIVRDGRPFDSTPGARAATLSFPFPSTTTGGVRTQHGIAKGGDFKDENLLKELKSLPVLGPLLVELNADGAIRQWFAPAPADALILQTKPYDKKTGRIERLLPLNKGDGLTDFNSQVSEQSQKEFHPVGTWKQGLGKPHDKAPRFWSWPKFEEWLRAPDSLAQPASSSLNLNELGNSGLIVETRTHVRVLGETLTADEGGLFQTRGLEFSQVERDDDGEFKRDIRLALAVATKDQITMQPGLKPFGGERRLTTWQKANTSACDLFNASCPEKIAEQIIEDRACRVVLLTPAHFTDGAIPAWLCSERGGTKGELKAMAINRAQVVSGWDFDQRYGPRGEGRPKPTRRLAPAGAVFFLKFESGTSEKAISDWIKETWMQCVSDDAQGGDPGQDRCDGFGLAVLGVWDGKLKSIEEGTNNAQN